MRKLPATAATVSAHTVMICAFVLWGGIGTLNSPTAPEIAGMFRVQDILSGAGGLVLAFFSLFRRYKRSAFMVIVACVYLLLYGILIGLANNNRLIDIAFEARILLYMILGLLVGISINNYTLLRSLQFYTLVVSLAILIQWFLLLGGSRVVFIHGVNPGNIFTGNIPLVRPSGFDLVGVGLILAISPWRPFDLSRRVIWLLVFVLIILQSKTYWVLVIFMVVFRLVVKALKFRSALSAITIKTGNWLALVVFITALLLAVLSGRIPESSHALVLMPYNKFKGLLTDPEIAYGVVGKRSDEAALMLKAWSGSLVSVLLGKGLGYMYRDPDVLFYRANPRDGERLAMFGHNFFLWLLLKFGLVGTMVFLGTILLAFLSAARRGGDQAHFGLGLAALLIGSLLLGSIESPTGAFLFGLLLSGSLKSEEVSGKTGSGRTNSAEMETERWKKSLIYCS